MREGDTGLIVRLAKFVREAWRQRGTGSLSKARPGRATGGHALFLRARIMMRAGDTAMAGRLYADAAALDPTLAEAFEARGEILDLAGQRDLSTKQYASARNVRTTLRPGAPDRHFALRQRGHFLAEIIAYDAVLRSLKKNALPHVARGNAYLAAGFPEKALADYDLALKLKPKSLDIAALRGEALSALGKYPEAIKAFDVALANRSSDPEILSGRAIANMGLGRLDDANADWRRQFDLLRDRPSARACVALRMADYQSALSQLESALAREPGDPYWQLYLLSARTRLGLPTGTVDVREADVWPGPLLALYAGRIAEDEVFKRADTDGRRTEAAFQVGLLAFAKDRAAAERRWREIVDRASPSMIEYAAARNELARPAP